MDMEKSGAPEYIKNYADLTAAYFRLMENVNADRKAAGSLKEIPMDLECIRNYTVAWQVIQMMPEAERRLMDPDCMDLLNKYKNPAAMRQFDLSKPLEQCNLPRGTMCVLAVVIIRSRLRLIHRMLDLMKMQRDEGSL